VRLPVFVDQLEILSVSLVERDVAIEILVGMSLEIVDLGAASHVARDHDAVERAQLGKTRDDQLFGRFALIFGRRVDRIAKETERGERGQARELLDRVERVDEVVGQVERRQARERRARRL
jgi:hypothetical protein